MTPPPEKGTYYAHPPPLSLDCSPITVSLVRKVDGPRAVIFNFGLTLRMVDTHNTYEHRWATEKSLHRGSIDDLWPSLHRHVFRKNILQLAALLLLLKRW